MKLLSPFAPHFAEELWEKLGQNQTIGYASWPDFNEEYLKEDEIMYPVQVNGKEGTARALGVTVKPMPLTLAPLGKCWENCEFRCIICFQCFSHI